MILVLSASEVPPEVAVELRNGLQATYSNRLEITLLREDDALQWPREQAWDDLIILLFGSKHLSSHARNFIAEEMEGAGQPRAILPISCGTVNMPPAPVATYKALPNDPVRIGRRVGAMLGMSLRNREQLVFISYRAIDGTKYAVQIENFLQSHGFQTWRDEARDDYDGEGSIPGGRKVQDVIHENVEKADLILLVDTPHSANSDWIKLEIDTANGLLVPVLPVLIRRPNERLVISRFRSLATLQRGIPIEKDGDDLSNSDLETILEEVENFLAEIFKRKLRVPFLVEREFTQRGYEWSERDHIICEALKAHSGSLRTRVYSHCSHFEGIFDPALLAFVNHLKTGWPSANYALYIYDGTIISDSQINDLRQLLNISDSTDIIILHNQEIAALLHTNFTSLHS